MKIIIDLNETKSSANDEKLAIAISEVSRNYIYISFFCSVFFSKNSK
jgi:hypothetical protein